MPYATNPIDGVRSYFEDAGGDRPPVLFYAGFPDPLAYSKTTGLARALQEEFRVIFADHRGFGRSDKPHDVEAYALETRVADVAAILDAVGIERAHFIGLSWGARLGFAVGEHAPERLLSLVLCGQQPYAWDPELPMFQAVSRAIEAGRRDGLRAFVETWERSIGERFPDPVRGWLLQNDFPAIDAAFRSVLREGEISDDLSRWRVPCLIFAGSEDDLHDDAERAAREIPGARFLSLEGHTHFSAEGEVDELLPHVLALFHETARRGTGEV